MAKKTVIRLVIEHGTRPGIPIQVLAKLLSNSPAEEPFGNPYGRKVQNRTILRNIVSAVEVVLERMGLTHAADKAFNYLWHSQDFRPGTFVIIIPGKNKPDRRWHTSIRPGCIVGLVWENYPESKEVGVKFLHESTEYNFGKETHRYHYDQCLPLRPPAGYLFRMRPMYKNAWWQRFDEDPDAKVQNALRYKRTKRGSAFGCIGKVSPADKNRAEERHTYENAFLPPDGGDIFEEEKKKEK